MDDLDLFLEDDALSNVSALGGLFDSLPPVGTIHN